MKLKKILSWLDATLVPSAFDDVSNNGLQVARSDDEVAKVAFAVDASARAVKAAASAGAGLLVAHHGLSWGGGIRRLTGGVYEVVRTAVGADVAVYACHLPLDAHPTLGNNAQLARELGLKGVKPAFSYHGNVIGLTGAGPARRVREGLARLGCANLGEGLGLAGAGTVKVGVCSGGAGEFAEEAKALGCDLYVTGEASWGDVVAAENVGMPMVCVGHYGTEVFGVRAVAKAMRRALKVETVDLTSAGLG